MSNHRIPRVRHNDRSQSNPLYSTTTSLLVGILRGDIDPVVMAAEELDARCKDHAGNHVGPKESTRIYNEFMAQRGGAA